MPPKKPSKKPARKPSREPGCTLADARRIALSLPEVIEQDHFCRPSFRVNKKIFATLWPEEGRAMVKFTPEQQDDHEGLAPFTPVPGTWGAMGATLIELAKIDKLALRASLTLAWKNVAPKRLVSRWHDSPRRAPD